MIDIGVATPRGHGRGYHQHETCQDDEKHVDGESSNKQQAARDVEASKVVDFSNCLLYTSDAADDL